MATRGGTTPGGDTSGGDGSSGSGSGSGSGDFSLDNAVFDSESLNRGSEGLETIGEHFEQLKKSISGTVGHYDAAFGGDNTGDEVRKNVNKMMQSITGVLGSMGKGFTQTGEKLRSQRERGERVEGGAEQAGNQLQQQLQQLQKQLQRQGETIPNEPRTLWEHDKVKGETIPNEPATVTAHAIQAPLLGQPQNENNQSGLQGRELVQRHVTPHGEQPSDPVPLEERKLVKILNLPLPPGAEGTGLQPRQLAVAYEVPLGQGETPPEGQPSELKPSGERGVPSVPPVGDSQDPDETPLEG